jgi:N-acetylneuraminate lyase
MRTFSGIWPALVTPLTDTGTVNVPVLRDIVGYLLGKGVDGFYIGGTTGEGIYLPVTERQRIVESVLQAVAGRVPVIVHVGTPVSNDAVALAQHAQTHGAAGVSSVLPPLYNDARSIQRYYATVAAAVPDLPFLSYLLNPNLDAVALMRSLMPIPNLAGTKYTGPNMYEMSRIIDMGKPEWTVFSGMDEEAVYADMLGVAGNIGSTLNFMPGAYREIGRLVRAGEFSAAHDLQRRANAVTTVMSEVGFGGALKAVMTRLGFPAGEPMLPNLPLSSEQKAELDRKLAETDFEALVAL